MNSMLINIKRTILIVIASFIFALNINSFVNAGGLFPGGFTGLTLLIQQIGQKFFNIAIPFSAVYLVLNSIPVFISYKYIGRKFTIFSCLAIILTSLFVDLLPGFPATDDLLLISIFGGIISGLAVSICLFAKATSGGTDFIAIFLSEKYGINAWNYILYGNIIILLAAGFLFGWDKALYSIIFQFASTQVLNGLYKRYQKNTLMIITDYPEEVYQQIKINTNHDATLFKGTGCYQKKERNMVYSVVSSDESKMIVSKIREVDANAFINVVKTEQVTGRFYKRPND